MEKRCERKSKNRYQITAIILLSILITGCTKSINAGTVPKVENEPFTANFETSATVSWFNGLENKETSIRVGKPIKETDLDLGIMIPDWCKDRTPELCSRWYVRIKGDNKMLEDIRPVYAVDSHGHNLVRNGESYPATGYAIGDGWYVFFIPNGVTDFSICVGNGLFYSEET